MIANLHQVIFLSVRKDNSQGKDGNPHRHTEISHPWVDEKNMGPYHHHASKYLNHISM
jgi:hypothetical protein